MRRPYFILTNAILAPLLGSAAFFLLDLQMDLTDTEDLKLYFTLMLAAAMAAGLSAFLLSGRGRMYWDRRLLQAVCVCVLAYALYCVLLPVWGTILQSVDVYGTPAIVGFSIMWTGLPALVLEYILLFAAGPRSDAIVDGRS